jgi:hypothetical protein
MKIVAQPFRAAFLKAASEPGLQARSLRYMRAECDQSPDDRLSLPSSSVWMTRCALAIMTADVRILSLPARALALIL